jgi:DNA-binding transcriptional regulator YiaG
MFRYVSTRQTVSPSPRGIRLLAFEHRKIRISRTHIPVNRKGTKAFPTSPTTLGERIRINRIEKGLLQSEMAEKLGVSRFQVGKWERNLVKPTESELAVVADFLGWQAR